MTQRKKAVRWYTKSLWFVGIPLTALTALILFWLVAPDESAVYYDYKMVTENSVYAPGETINVVTSGTYCNEGVDTRTERRIENEIGGIVLFPVYFFAPADSICFQRNAFSVTIPPVLPPGRWRLALVTTYQANPVRSVSIENYSNWFEVK